MKTKKYHPDECYKGWYDADRARLHEPPFNYDAVQHNAYMAGYEVRRNGLTVFKMRAYQRERD